MFNHPYLLFVHGAALKTLSDVVKSLIATTFRFERGLAAAATWANLTL